jgi:hypothetical protein
MTYRIVVGSELDPRAMAVVGDLEMRRRGAQTELVGEIVDQSQLVGIVSRFASPDVEVISVAPMPAVDSPRKSAAIAASIRERDAMTATRDARPG